MPYPRINNWTVYLDFHKEEVENDLFTFHARLFIFLIGEDGKNFSYSPFIIHRASEVYECVSELNREGNFFRRQIYLYYLLKNSRILETISHDIKISKGVLENFINCHIDYLNKISNGVYVNNGRYFEWV